MAANDVAKRIELSFKQVHQAHGSTFLNKRPRKPDAARKAILALPSIDAQLTSVHHPSNTILHEVVTVATREEASDAGWRKGTSSSGEISSRRKFARELVAFILEQKPDLGVRNAKDETVLHLAAAGHPDILERLLDSGADPNTTCKIGFTPLMNACGTKHPRARNVELLLAAGADPNARLKNGRTAKHMLPRTQKEIAKLLGSAKASDTTEVKPSKHPARDARDGKLDALSAIADGDPSTDNDYLAYKWLCAAKDFGHKKAAALAADVLETTSMHADDDGLLQGDAHWELAIAYLEAADGLPKNFEHARAHLASAAELLGAGLARRCEPKLRKRLSAEACAVLEAVIGRAPKRRARR